MLNITWTRRLLAFGMILCLSPLMLALIGEGFAAALGCALPESGLATCPSAVGDVGPMITALTIVGWAGIVTIPIASALFVVWGVIEMVYAARKRKPR